MKRPLSIYFVIFCLLLLGIYGLWACWELWQNYRTGDPIYYGLTILYIFAAISLYLRKNWSKYLVYLISAFTSGTWLLAIWVIVENGWPHSSIQASIISLVPGCFLLTVCICSSLIVHKYFKVKSVSTYANN